MKDPLIKKRKAQAKDEEAAKKSKIEESAEDQIKKVTLPYADKPYSDQLVLKKAEMKNVLTNLTKEIKKANFKIKPFIRKQEEVNDGLICSFTDVVPSPSPVNYRNKCEFTVGN